MNGLTQHRRGEDYPLTMWWQITNHLTSIKDVHTFSRVSKGMNELLAYRRAVMEVKHYIASLGMIHLWKHLRHPVRSCVENAIRRHQPLEVIETMVRGCFSLSGSYLNGTESMLMNHQPAIFVAAEMNRVDVIEMLLEEAGSPNLFLVYPANGDCGDCLQSGHYECSKNDTCRNALCIAREHKSKDAVELLLKEGAEDRCGSHCAQWHH